jgi:RecB family exonuclease
VATAKTFIPYNLRRAFGLSTLEHQDAIFAYVFYRLLHRCRHMQVVYNTLITENSTGEPSRFLQQLALESGFDIVYSQYEMPVRATPPLEIKVHKSPAIARNLYKYTKPDAPVGLSPSAINKYLSCRLQFFFSYIANIAAPEQMQTEIDAAIFGSAVHSLLERVYERWQQQHPGAAITLQAIDTMRAWLPEMALDAIRDAWYAEQNTTNRLSLSGFEAVVADVVEQFAYRFLDIDAKRVPFKVHHLEVTFKQELDLTVQGQPQRILLKGNIDRVDEKDGVVRMVDFKTGNDKIEFASVQELLTPHGEKLNKGALQTLLYAYMFSKAHPQYKHFEPALVVLRHTLKAGFDKVRLVDKAGGSEVTAENINDYLPTVAEGLKVVLEELLDTHVPFDQTPHLTTCGYCDYKGICGR